MPQKTNTTLKWKSKINYVYCNFSNYRLDRYSKCENFLISKFENSNGYIVSKKIVYKNCIGETETGYEPLHDVTDKFTTLKKAKQYAAKNI
jgi:hypothetical protein